MRYAHTYELFKQIREPSKYGANKSRAGLYEITNPYIEHLIKIEMGEDIYKSKKERIINVYDSESLVKPVTVEEILSPLELEIRQKALDKAKKVGVK